ncbi:MAG: DUF975 family protein [Flavobacteriales bacterium]|nr:DUF975 family protein [Flavobacteriales bacterium]
MGTENSILRKQALESLKGNWVMAILIFFVWGLFMSIGGTVEEGKGGVIALIIGGPLSFGMAKVSLAYSRGYKVELEMLFDGFKNFVNTFLAYLLISVFTMLWLLLLIVPGIIKGISYSMTFFIMNDEPELKAMEAIDKSMAMMNGYKMKYFLLLLLFFVLMILSALLAFIPLLWLIPYMYVTFAKFYEDIKDKPILIDN